jgi:hypothetical protein
VAEILREEFFHAGIVELARVELRGSLGRRNRLRLESSAARNRGNSAQKRPNFHAGSHVLKLLGGHAAGQYFETARAKSRIHATVYPMPSDGLPEKSGG